MQFDWSAIWPANSALLWRALKPCDPVLGLAGGLLLDWRQVLPVRLAAGSPTTFPPRVSLKLFPRHAHRCPCHVYLLRPADGI